MNFDMEEIHNKEKYMNWEEEKSELRNKVKVCAKKAGQKCDGTYVSVFKFANEYGKEDFLNDMSVYNKAYQIYDALFNCDPVFGGMIWEYFAELNENCSVEQKDFINLAIDNIDLLTTLSLEETQER